MVLTLVMTGCAGGGASTSDPTRSDLARGTSFLGGLPQVGNTLGDARAPATGELFVEVGDLNMNLAHDLLPALVQGYVRSGRLKLQLRTVSRGPAAAFDARAPELARLTQAVGLVNGRLWSFYLAYATLTVGVVEDTTTRQALAAVGARDVPRLRAAAGSRRVSSAIARANRLARAAGGTVPMLLLTDERGSTHRIRLDRFPSRSTFLKRVGAALGGVSPK